MSRTPARRKCRCCKTFFHPDYRNAARQDYCRAPACRQASKLASQRRWRRSASGRDYFRGKEEVQRVQEWRRQHPGYWKKQKPRSDHAQAPDPQPVNPEQISRNVPTRDLRTLQDFCLTEDPAFVGLISWVTGRTLQEDIAQTARNLLLHGQNILGLKTSGPTSPMPPPSTHEKAPSAA